MARPDTPEILQHLVSFDTTSARSNLEIIGWIRSWLDALHIPCRVSHTPDGGKANLHAIIGPMVGGGIALAGHLDTVPVTGQAWSGDPFQLRAEGDRLIGRGAVDMKGFVAACLASAPDLARAPLVRPLHLFFTYDEEVGCHGARALIETLDAWAPRPALCVVGEPTGMQPVIAHKGRLAARVRVRGTPGHSSQPGRGVNAIHCAAEAIAWLARDARRFACEGPFEPGYDPPHTTLQVGTVTGGAALNMIPEQAEFALEWRTIAADDFFRELDRLRAHIAATIEPEMHRLAPESGFGIEVTDWIPGLSLPGDHALATLVRQLTGANDVAKVSYGTEAGLYQQAGIPSIVCGPGFIAQAHQPDEWISRAQLAVCDSFIRRLGGWLAA